MRCSEPNSAANALAAVGPTCRIDSATSTLHSGLSLAESRLASKRFPLADRDPALVRKIGTSISFSASSEKRSPSSPMTFASNNPVAAS